MSYKPRIEIINSTFSFFKIIESKRSNLKRGNKASKTDRRDYELSLSSEENQPRNKFK